jgi:hypothetical protein
MAASKSSSASAVVGRRLRRFLGALLTLGFGVAWLCFERPTSVEAAVPVIAATAPVKFGNPHVIGVAMVTPPRLEARVAPPRRAVIRPRPRPVAHRVTKVPSVIVRRPVTEPPPVTKRTPVIETLPVIERTPVIETPVIETPPVVETPPVDDATSVENLPPIRTRSS